jgi:hypothetical protein
MSLFFIGCSHTYGDDLANPNTQAWPALIADAKNKSFVNFAVSGGTNDRNVYHTIKNSDLHDHYYIAWTYVNRFTRYRNENNFEINFNPHLTNSLYGNEFSFVDYGKLHYAYWYNELYAFKNWLQQIILVQLYLKSKNKSYTMINSCPNNINRWTSDCDSFNNNVKLLLCFDFMDDNQLMDEHKEIKNLLGEIKFTNYLGWGEWCITDLSSIYPTGPTDHLLEQGHQAVADYILTHDTY